MLPDLTPWAAVWIHLGIGLVTIGIVWWLARYIRTYDDVINNHAERIDTVTDESRETRVWLNDQFGPPPADDTPTNDFAKTLIRTALDEPATSPDMPAVTKPVIREAPTNPAMSAIRPTVRKPAGATAASAIDDEWQRRRQELLGE